MSSNSDESTDPELDLSNLETIKEFDMTDPAGQAQFNTVMKKDKHQKVGQLYKVVNSNTASTPVSLLVETLVRQLCAFVEPNTEKAEQIYTTMCEQLYKMNLIDESYAMSEFEMMRTQYQKALRALLEVSRNKALPIELDGSEWPLASSEDREWSRYYKEFEQIGFIADGGFGKVYKARHKLDGIVYAIKQITIESTLVHKVLVHLAEVKTFASLNHQSIVPYKAAWLEPLLVHPTKEPSEPSEESVEEEEEEEEESSEEMVNNYTKDVSGSSFISFARSESQEPQETQASQVTTENETKNKLQVESSRRINVNESQPHVKLKWAVLYIQMTLCQLTLKEFLEERNNSTDLERFYVEFKNRNHSNDIHTSRSFDRTFSEEDEEDTSDRSTHLEVVTNIFTQLMYGLSYIHSRGIIHHDIKPSNVFVSVDKSGKIIVQLGDFGLACPLENAHSGKGFGTPLYAAPEQLNGECNHKSDIYSLGIILLELLVPFTTVMERANAIKELKRGNAPDGICPGHKSLLKRLLDARPDKRPDASQLIEIMGKLGSKTDEKITELQRKVSERDTQIQQLQQQMEEQKKNLALDKDKEIERLRAKISELELRQGK